METTERFHLLTLVIDEKNDLGRVREKAALLARMSNIGIVEAEMVASSITDLAQDHLRHHRHGRMRYFLGRDPQGQNWFEMICEMRNREGGPQGVDPCTIRQLQKIMDKVEVEERQEGMKIRAIKQGARHELNGASGRLDPFREEVFLDTEKSCLENLREKHEELQRQLEERSQQNEELNRLNAELFHLNRDLETAAAERAVSEMALHIAHEIRNPATVIGGLVNVLLKEGALPERDRTKAETVIRKAKQLEEIVVQFEKLAAQRRYFKRNEDLGKIMEESADILRQEFNRKGVSLDLHAIGGLKFKANVGMLKIALTHLLRNALEACQAGGRVAFSLSKTPRGHQIRIEDNGAGIPPEKLEHIFEPFVTTKPSRIGLGLPIVKQIVEEHRGKLSLQSEPGEGTLATLEFPVIYFPSRTESF
jgi:signal transduction histidine kinase